MNNIIDNIFKKALKDKLMSLNKEKLVDSLVDIYIAVITPTAYSNIANAVCQQQACIRYKDLNQQSAICHQTINELIKKIEEHEKNIEKNT